ncbi:MAG: hypothetical protein Q8Q32_02070 [bacterium]|nr:hypothetical protein [bacterium]
MAFAMMPKEDALVAQCDLWCLFTGDGPDLVTKGIVGREIPDMHRKNIFITGADNLCVEHGTQHSSDFRDIFLEKKECDAFAAELVCVDDTAQYTHGQADSLLRYLLACMRNKSGVFSKVALFTSGHHILRSWLACIARLNAAIEAEEDASARGMLSKVCILPVPSYHIPFGTPPEDMVEEDWNGWVLFSREGLPRILNYQEKFPQNMASWEMADEHMRLVMDDHQIAG